MMCTAPRVAIAALRSILDNLNGLNVSKHATPQRLIWHPSSQHGQGDFLLCREGARCAKGGGVCIVPWQCGIFGVDVTISNPTCLDTVLALYPAKFAATNVALIACTNSARISNQWQILGTMFCRVFI
jgi:hypothetical protein